MNTIASKTLTIDGVPMRVPGCQECGLCLCRKEKSPVNEIEQITLEVIRRLTGKVTSQEIGVPVGVSVRHVHLSQEVLDQLYGPGYRLTKLRDLEQPGQYAANETVTVVGPRMRVIERVRILCPLRNYSQVELSRTDGITLGLDLPVRDSGDLSDAAPVTLVGPAGSVTLLHGAIRATRHVHMSAGDAKRFSLDGVRQVRVRIGGEKGLIFEQVFLKTGDEFMPELHLDTDDANAAELTCGDRVIIEKVA